MSKRDFYEILGVNKSSTKEEIKKATKPLLDTMNTRITDAIWDREDRLRFIISPMGEWLWKSLNENDFNIFY